jgi:N-acetylglutamate synthase-like GNAT family acetyltransferase
MELANLWGAAADVAHIRVATEADATDISQLLRRASHSHIHSGWYLPVHWLGRPTFVVYERPEAAHSFMHKLAGDTLTLQACLAAVADPPPAAWMQVAAIRPMDEPLTVLAAMLEQIEHSLRQTAVTQLGWMIINDWPTQWLTDLGFIEISRVQTYRKRDMHVPDFKGNASLLIRPAQTPDMAQLAQIEVAAFAPLWRHSASALRAALPQAYSFDVAVLNGELVGFQLSTCTDNIAHLARLTISPSAQHQGVGSTLLAHAIAGYKRQSLRSISLNTQVDNKASQRLYQKFGFTPREQWLSIWAKEL